MANFLCSTNILLLLTAIPIAIIITLESATPTTHYYQFHSSGWMRESSKWDEVNRRFIVSLTDTGGLGVVHVPDDHNPNVVLEEISVVKNTGNGTCGVFIDRARNRVLVAVSDVFGNSYSAVAAYDLDSWKRLFFTHLTSSAGGGKTFANDVTVDAEGNAYVTDVKVTVVKVDGKLALADGLELLSPTKLVVAGANGVKLVETDDDWLTASVVGRSPVIKHRIATAATVKDGKVYINHALGMGYPKKKHVFVEAAFT
ncbi:hypothetical protein L1987_76765 [Smallanthus sonchifolius]|uniref:Uncharacterized protein n=1 Tax=Smallanthus sonchifolius TaxID=185202 RepID=A0ACB8Z8Z6_9ASTR|nr:hypothetical protein L1987_76765 [Smallanthus sonchifolius]